MRSVRLPKEIEHELEVLSNQKDISRSEIIKEALVEYMAKEKTYNQPFITGKKYFGKHSSGDHNRSVSYKSEIQSKIREKRSD